jgi:ceramide synthetase
MIHGGFDLSVLMCNIFNTKRKDFWKIFLHDIFTICLISFSWIINGVRYGTLILICHDFSDIFLHLTKLIRHAKGYIKLKQIISGFLMISWIFTRLIYFPIILWIGIRGVSRFIQPDYEVDYM